MLEEYLKANCYARFHSHSYHCCREMHNNSRLEVKRRSRAPGHGVCLTSVSRNATMQGFTATEKCTSILDLT